MKGLTIVLSSMMLAGAVTFASAQGTPDTTAAAENQIDMDNQEDFQQGIKYQDTTARDQQNQQDTTTYGFEVDQDTTAMNKPDTTSGFGFEGSQQDTTAMLDCPESYTKNESLEELKDVEGDVRLEYETDQGTYMYQKEKGEVTERFEGSEIEAMLQKDKKSGDRQFEYETDKKEYQYEESDSEVKESYEGPEKEWEIEKEKDKKKSKKNK